LDPDSKPSSVEVTKDWHLKEVDEDTVAASVFMGEVIGFGPVDV
jgi:hypothetical protein